jgi:hypothetical protein
MGVTGQGIGDQRRASLRNFFLQTAIIDQLGALSD